MRPYQSKGEGGRVEETRRGPLAHDLGHEEGCTQENESDCQFPSGMAPSINHRKPALGEERRAGMEGEMKTGHQGEETT